MFQFTGFPLHTYGFSMQWRRFAPPGFPIQTSAGQRIFAPHRSFSQLITSFVGSQCQGIHLVLFSAWPLGFFRILCQPYSVTVGSSSFSALSFLFSEIDLMKLNQILFWIFDVFLLFDMQFSRCNPAFAFLTVLPVIKSQKFFWPFIAGKALFLNVPAATYSPIPSPV